MKLHDLRPPDGSRTPRVRVGRGIAAGKGKTAGRGTKGQKARAGGSIPPWFEGGQTPLHMRIPKLRGFRNRGKIDFEIVNVGDIARVVDEGRLPAGQSVGGRSKAQAPVTVNQDLLMGAGLVRTLAKPMKVLGTGEVSVALFVVADAFSKSAREKIEAAGGSVNVLEVPGRKAPAVGADRGTESATTPTEAAPVVEGRAPAAPDSGEASPETAEARPETPEPEASAEPVAVAEPEAPAEADLAGAAAAAEVAELEAAAPESEASDVVSDEAAESPETPEPAEAPEPDEPDKA